MESEFNLGVSYVLFRMEKALADNGSEGMVKELRKMEIEEAYREYEDEDDN